MDFDEGNMELDYRSDQNPVRLPMADVPTNPQIAMAVEDSP